MMGYIERIVPDTPQFQNLYDEHINRYMFARGLFREGESALDFGCGCGYGSNYLAREGFQVTGIDLSTEAIGLAEEYFQQPEIDFQCMDGRQLELADDMFGNVVAIEILEHVQEPRACLLEIKRVIKPGGILVASVPNRKMFPRVDNPWHFFHLDVEEFQALLGEFFDDLEIFGQNRLNPSIDSRGGLHATSYKTWTIHNQDIENSLCLLAICRLPAKI